MLDHASLGDEDRFLGDVRGKIGDALEVPAHKEQLQSARHRLR
jgi:hypothetical protein